MLLVKDLNINITIIVTCNQKISLSQWKRKDNHKIDRIRSQ